MIALDKLTKKLQIVLDAVPDFELSWQISFADDDAWGSKYGETNGTTVVDLCTGIQGTPSPTIYGVRKIANFNVFNPNDDAVSVSIIYFSSPSSVIVVKVTLMSGYTLHYDNRWYVTDMSGSETSVQIIIVPDGDYGDITVSSSGTVWTIDNGAVTYSKIQNITATDKILGRQAAGAGVIEEITCTSFARTILDDTTAAQVRSTIGAGTGNGDALTSSPLSQFASTTSAQLASVISDETGTNKLVFSDGPTLVNPIVGTQTANDNSTKAASTAYVDSADSGKLSVSLESAHVFVGNASNVATDVALSGDATISNAGALTIANDAITNAKLADMATATFKGRTTAGTGNPEDLSVAQAYALLQASVKDDSYFIIRCSTNNTLSPADATTYYFGAAFGGLNTAAKTRRLSPPTNCVLIGAAIAAINTAGVTTTETSTIAVLKNNVTSVTLSSAVVFPTAAGNDANDYISSGLSTTFNGTTDYLECTWLTPTWSTNPTGAALSVDLLFKRA